MGVRLRRLDWYIAVVGLVTLLWVCWSGKGLLYDLQYDLPASRFAHPDGSYSVSQDDDSQSDRSDGPGPVRMVAKAHNLMELDQSFEGTGDASEVFMRDASMKLSSEYKETFEVNETHFELFRKDGKLERHARPAEMRSDFQANFRRRGNDTHVESDSDDEPAWAFYPGDNIPKEFPLPPEGHPVVNIYAINHRYRTLYFAQGARRFNLIPPKAVARQSTFGGEDWTVIDDINTVYKTITVDYGNQVIEIEATALTPVPLTPHQVAEADGIVVGDP